MFTILTRTSNRPNYFKTCRQSVTDQTQRAYHLIATDDEADTYPEGDYILHVDKRPGRCHNLYFNTMRWRVPNEHQWVMFLDDDDQFTRTDALDIIQKNIVDEKSLVFWKVDLGGPGPIIPRGWGVRPRKGDITGIGFAVHVKHWENWQGVPYGDFEVINRYYDKLNPVWIREVLTKCQTGTGHGERRDKKL